MFPPASKKGMVKFQEKGTLSAQRHAKGALLSALGHTKRALKFNCHLHVILNCIPPWSTIRRMKLQVQLAFLAHLSRRLIGDLIVYPWSSVRHGPSVVRRPQCSNIFFSETPCPIKAKFYVEPPWVGGTKFCSRHLSHVTKMAATPIYGKNPSKIFFSRTGGPIFTKLGM